MRRTLVVETVSSALETDAMDAGRQGDKSGRARGARRPPLTRIDGRHGILRKSVQDVGEQKLLMLLLVMQPDLENTQHFRQLRVLRALEQSLDGRVDMGAEGGNAFAVRPREEPPPRPRVARPGGDVIGIEEIRELLVEDPITGKMGDQDELLEEPRRVRAMPFGRAGVRHRLHQLVLGAQGSGAMLGLRAHGAEGIAPKGARIVGGGAYGRCVFATTAKTAG